MSIKTGFGMNFLQQQFFLLNLAQRYEAWSNFGKRMGINLQKMLNNVNCHMFKSYTEIFSRRGDAYHTAMLNCPKARDAEFQAALSLANPQIGETLVDMPAGGGYLLEYADLKGVRSIAIDPSPLFFLRCQDWLAETYCCPLTNLPLKSGEVDVVVSLAGLHHEGDRLSIFREVKRVLRKGGRLAIAEVAHNSSVARFLDEFVDAHNPDGHIGKYINDGFRAEISEAGLTLKQDRAAYYQWWFSTTDQLADFIRLMFGLEQITNAEIVQGVKEYLGPLEFGSQGIGLPWSLHLLLATNEDSSEA
jgi:SAM-dependent methyltransferase